MSRIFEPVLLFSVLFVLILLRASLTFYEVLLVSGIVFIGVLFPTFGLLVYALRTKKISNWDISNRKERVKALCIFLLFLLCGAIGIACVGRMIVTNFFVLITIMYFLFFLITLWFKISGHMTMATLFVGTLIVWFGGFTWLLVFALPVLAWSRVVLKRHTRLQVITGIIFGACIVGVGILLHLI